MKRFPTSVQLLFYNTSISVLTIFFVKLTIILFKALICLSFGIDITITGFWLKAVSSADSGLWDQASVYAVYGAELLIPLILFSGGLFFYTRFKLLNQQKTVYTVWLMFYSSLSFFSAIISGAVTHSNAYHLLNWLHLPIHIIMAMALASPLLFLSLLYYDRGRILKLAPDNSWLENISGRRRTHLFGMSLPLLTTALILYFLAGGHPNRYAAYESGLIAISAISILLFTPGYMYRLVPDNWLPSHLKGLLTASIFVVIIALLRWVF